MKKSEYQNPKSKTNSNDVNTRLAEALAKRAKFKIVSSFVFRISNFRFQRGQALVTLLFFVIISITISSAAVIMAIANTTSTSKIQEGIVAYYVAESGVENALLRLLRDPNYSGETLNIGTSTAVVTVIIVNPNVKTVVSVGQNGNFKRTVQAQMTYTNGYYTFTNWKEI